MLNLYKYNLNLYRRLCTNLLILDNNAYLIENKYSMLLNIYFK